MTDYKTLAYDFFVRMNVVNHVDLSRDKFNKLDDDIKKELYHASLCN